MNHRYHYRLFGLTIASAVELPELAMATPVSVADIEIAVGAMPGDAPVTTGTHILDDGVVLRFADAGAFWVRSGDTVVVEPDGVSPDANIRLYLLGSVMGVVLHQRRLLPIHANGVEVDGHAFLFMAEPGAGKSTLAAAFDQLGQPVLADDVCVVRSVSDGPPLVFPGLPRLRLWGDALVRTGRREEDYQRSFPTDPGYAKYDVPLARSIEATPLPMGGAYRLGRGAHFAVTRLTGARAVAALSENTYRGGLVDRLGELGGHLRQCLDLATRVPVFEVERRWAAAAIVDDARLIVAHCRAVIAERAAMP